MKSIVLVILSLLSFQLNAQEIIVIETIENVSRTRRASDFEAAVNKLRFSCIKVDTVEGIEIEIFYKKDELTCLNYMFFVETCDTAITNANMFQWLLLNHDKYYHLYGGSSFFSEFCNFLDNTDSFLFCNNVYSYDTLNYSRKDIYSDEVYYTKNKKIYFTLNFVKATAYRFVSADTAYSRYYHHFSVDESPDKINILRYKQVYQRDRCSNKVVFGNLLGTRRKYAHVKLDCFIFAD